MCIRDRGGGMLGLSMVTGSNVAPLFTLVPLVPNIVSNLGLDPITTMLGMQNGASLGSVSYTHLGYCHYRRSGPCQGTQVL